MFIDCGLILFDLGCIIVCKLILTFKYSNNTSNKLKLVCMAASNANTHE